MTNLRLLLIIKLLAFFFVFYAVPSAATPPLSAQSQDHPIAVSQTHLYVMRHVSDNIGRYQAERSKTYILKLETKTSKLIEFHILQDSIQGENAAQSNITANKGFNLFAYLEKEKAFQIGLLKPRPHQKITVEKKEEASLLSRNFSGQIEGQYQNRKENSSIYQANLIAMVNASLSEIMSDYIGPIPDPIPNIEIYNVSLEIDPQSGGSCRVTNAINAPQPLAKLNHKIQSNEFIIYVTCLTAGDRITIEAILPLALSFNPAK